MYSTNTADFCGLCEPRINDRKDIYKNHPQVEQNQKCNTLKKHKRGSRTSVDFYKSCFNFANYPIFCGKLPISHLLRYSIAHRAFHMLLNMKKRMRNLLQSLPNQNENKKVKQKKEAALVNAPLLRAIIARFPAY